ncbi:methyltransferase domain-containing protein [Streptomyces sp. NPDC008125]|uniref:class I SAM-dependent methyltransferase n=1 Tax=Streptomyces sp. NPDC008125 TaxID=3364811 RepID=UPI0036E17532
MSTEINPDFGLTAEDCTRHRAGFPPEIVERLAASEPRCGTGTCWTSASGPAVSPGSSPGPGHGSPESAHAAALLEQARGLDREAAVEIAYEVATAEDTGLPDASFDVVSAGQCRHWFDAPRATAGFGAIETFPFDLDVPYTPQAWTGRIRAGVGASLTAERVEAFTADLGGIVRDRFPGDVLRAPHRTWAVVAVKPAEEAGR